MRTSLQREGQVPTKMRTSHLRANADFKRRSKQLRV